MQNSGVQIIFYISPNVEIDISVDSSQSFRVVHMNIIGSAGPKQHGWKLLILQINSPIHLSSLKFPLELQYECCHRYKIDQDNV